MNKDIIIAIDAGTSVLKAVAFSLHGKELATTSTANIYKTSEDGKATQSPIETWKHCVKIISELKLKLPGLENRACVIAVTGQGDGTWLIDEEGNPVCDAWLWMDSRAAEIAKKLASYPSEEERFKATGTGMFAGQQSCQLAFIESFSPDILDKSDTAFHCKDWLYMKLTGIRATDPSEACFTFGNFRTKQYDDNVIKGIGLSNRKSLFPTILDGSKITHPLSEEAAKITGLTAGTPVSLAFLDGVCSCLGSGGFDPLKKVGNTLIGTTGVHMQSSIVSDVSLDLKAKTGYVTVLPISNYVLQIQSNMSGALNIDWLSGVAKDLFQDFDINIKSEDFISRIDKWVNSTTPGKILYHPYISDAGERGPFIDNFARASIIGLKSNHRFPEIVRAVIEGLSMASRDCYLAMGKIPSEIRLAGGAAQSKVLRKIFSSALKASVRTSNRKEPGASGAAMIGAMAIGVYENWDKCINDWVTPQLGEIEKYDSSLSEVYDKLFEIYLKSRLSLAPIWPKIS